MVMLIVMGINWEHVRNCMQTENSGSSIKWEVASQEAHKLLLLGTLGNVLAIHLTHHIICCVER